jgi:hypothetical protein
MLHLVQEQPAVQGSYVQLLKRLFLLFVISLSFKPLSPYITSGHVFIFDFGGRPCQRRNRWCLDLC